ncbi:MAG: hypothetical protein ACRC0C_11090 [Gibbsiella quercinecans]|uniref:hypothetical protein n=1 Tax=Gibbsiella quercinecans TaxID=929813 RepID=UPI003F305D5A
MSSVYKRAMPYISKNALADWLEQRTIETAHRKAAYRDQQQQSLTARAALIADFSQSIGIALPQEAALSVLAQT